MNKPMIPKNDNPIKAKILYPEESSIEMKKNIKNINHKIENTVSTVKFLNKFISNKLITQQINS